MNYQAAALSLMRYRLAAGEHVSVNALALAAAVDAYDPGQLDNDGIGFTYRGKRLALHHATLAPLVGVAGVSYAPLVEESGYPLAIDSAPAVPLGSAGPNNRAFIRALRLLWTKRVAPLGLVDVSRVLRALDVGVIAMPASPARLRLLAPSTAADFLAPAGGGQAWPLVVAEFKEAWTLYIGGQLDKARAACEASDANAERWATIETAVRAVRDLPATIAAEGLKLPFRILGALGPANWLLLCAAGVGVLIWYNRAAVARVAGRVAARQAARLVGA